MLGSRAAERLDFAGARLGGGLAAQQKPEVVLEAAVEGVFDGQLDGFAGGLALRNRTGDNCRCCG